VHNFRKLSVWTRARYLAVEIHALCATATRPDKRIVTSQLKRSALSIGANIAEGCGKRSRAETIRYLEIAAGSAAETEHHLTLAADLAILPGHRCEELAERAAAIRRSIRTLIERFPSERSTRAN
jgi:four helix bundle protein